MTAQQVIALLVMPVGGLVLGFGVLWLTSRPRHGRTPAE